MISGKVVCDSIFNGNRLTTLEIELHRFVLPEFNTHRTFSRNFQSSRAVPVEKMIEQVRTDPAMPVHWGKNRPGMQANEELSGQDLINVKREWLTASASAVYHAKLLESIGAHKQIVNRVLEPFMWTKGVVTATEKAWNAFFDLRCHRDAQPEIQALAFEIKKVLEESEPVERKEGDWHLPYVREGVNFSGKQFFTQEQQEVVKTELDLKNAIQISASCCGQVSYRKLDDSLDKAIKIYDMLNLPKNGVDKENPPHFSPTEHQVKFSEGYEIKWSGNFQTEGFMQYRKALEKGIESKLF